MALVTALALGGVAKAGAQGPRPVQRPVGEGSVDWTHDVVEAQGVASPRVISPHADWIEGALAAQADLRSLRNLREVLAAIPLDSDRSVADVLKGTVIKGLAERAEEVRRETLSDGTSIRRVRLPLDTLRTRAGVERPADTAADKGAVVVVEARRTGVTPALTMTLRDEAGTALWRGPARYASERLRTLRRARLLKASGLAGKLGVDLVLRERAAERLRGLDKPPSEVWVITESWIHR